MLRWIALGLIVFGPAASSAAAQPESAIRIGCQSQETLDRLYVAVAMDRAKGVKLIEAELISGQCRAFRPGDDFVVVARHPQRSLVRVRPLGGWINDYWIAAEAAAWAR